MAVRVAIDTNCLVAALTNPRGSCAEIVRRWLDGRLEAVASAATVAEAELILGGRWLGRIVGRERVEEILEALRTRTVWVDDPPQIRELRLKDAGDRHMVETAVAGGASHVVTTDREFLSHRGYGQVEFVTPVELLKLLRNDR